MNLTCVCAAIFHLLTTDRCYFGCLFKYHPPQNQTDIPKFLKTESLMNLALFNFFHYLFVFSVWSKFLSQSSLQTDWFTRGRWRTETSNECDFSLRSETHGNYMGVNH